MIELRTADEIRNAEAILLAALPDGALMRRAATGLEIACARLIESAVGDLTGVRVVLLVGSGNNGGDALWAGAGLANRGCRVNAIAIADRAHADGTAALARAGGRMHRWDANDPRISSIIDEADVVIDGILGIGGDGALRLDAAAVVDLVARSGAIVVAVDVPSGVSADTGAIEGAAVSADV
ncbi:MAG: NAD(P)H-hydrate epimerase, partial [bacterium]|nr:NAD(P)H-hydrate epimerase [bacterium]